MSNSLPKLHCFGQNTPHGDLLIVGDEAALVQLRDTIAVAIKTGDGMCSLMTNDGEGYFAIVGKAPGGAMEGMPTPYEDEWGGGEPRANAYVHRLVCRCYERMRAERAGKPE